MPNADPQISQFIESARASGASDQTVVGILTAHGWSEKEAYQALAAHYYSLTKMDVPRRPGSGTAARDAFFYLVIFSTLATWTCGLGSVAFTLIDHWFVDALYSAGAEYDTYAMAVALACVIVAFPIYLLVSRTALREARNHPEKTHSPVRKWLTYMALVLAAGWLVGDLITVLAYFLRGEITSRFLAKAFVVLVLSGGVLFYYYGGLKKSEESPSQARSTRDSWMAALAALVALVMIVLGFRYLGAPKTQRALRADQSRVQDLYSLSSEISRRLRFVSGAKMPAHLDELTNVRTADPVSQIGYEYRLKEGTQYELCATFSLPSPQHPASGRPDPWAHPAGHYCFSLDANRQPENPNFYPRF